MKMTTIKVPLEAEGNMTTLSQMEVAALLDASQTGLYETFRRCCLAVLNSGNDESDNVKHILSMHRRFAVALDSKNGGIEVELSFPPASAFVDGQIIQGIREHLYAVMRDILFAHTEVVASARFDFDQPEQLTSGVFEILRNANVLRPRAGSRLAVCWGGHSIPRDEYEYTKQVGYHLGLRGLDICTGCGPGAMKGPMKGAAIGHSKQRNRRGRYVGISEPGIIAAESPNPIVNQLVIMPDIEKRLEAFVRLGHAFVIFPGGVGTAEELFYILAILLDPANAGREFPLILSGPACTARYFDALHDFIGQTLGESAHDKYEIVIDDPEHVARLVRERVNDGDTQRRAQDDPTYFNWKLHIDPELQRPFEPTHSNMAELDLAPEQAPHILAAALRCAFSGIVAGNIKDTGIGLIETGGPLPIRGPRSVIEPLEALLASFVAQGRMSGQVHYSPTYRLETI